MLTREELHKIVKDIHPKLFPNNISQSLRKSGYGGLIEQIEFYTPYLEDRKFKERYYHILHNLTDKPKCSICDKVYINAFGTIEKGYIVDKCISCASKLKMIKGRVILAETLRDKYYQSHVDYLGDDYEFLTSKEEYIKTGRMSYRHLKCGKTTERKLAFQNGCKWCAYIGSSKPEREIRDWLLQYIDVDFNKRKYLDNKYEIDIYIPSKKLGIEYHGLWVHSELNNTNKNYHLDKLEYAKLKDIQLIQVFENEWLFKRDIVKSIILSKINIYDNKYFARKCEIRSINNKTKDEFLQNNHLQGKDKSSIYLGLFHNDELLSVMTFGKRQISGKVTFEMFRFCNKLNTQVVGGASKLLKHFLTNYDTSEPIISYADKRFSTGELYNKLGFVELKDSPPNYWYFKKNEGVLYHRAGFMKHMLSQKLESFDINKTEWENMVNNKYNRIWDCGNKVYVLYK